MKNLEQLKSILGNANAMIEAANACDKAYAVGTGNPEWHTPFGAEKPEQVAMNVAGIQAVVSGIGIMATLRGATNPEEVDALVVPILNDIIDAKITRQEESILLRLANCAWGAGQAFRTDKGALGRMTKMNVFDLLPHDEVVKDLHQIIAAAKFLWMQI